MSSGSVENHIDAVDAYARTLFLRLRQTPSIEIADGVRQLHTALRHLRIEAGDQDSLLADPESIYSRQLRPLVDSVGDTLGLLEDALNDGAGMESAKNRLRGEKASVDGFLDAVQLQKSKAVVRVVTDQGDLEHIKDKVDKVAKRVFSRRDSGLVDDEDRVWKEFKSELEKEGFSPAVLKQHKDVLRAYIRSLESMSSQNGGAPPSVRGLLEYEAESNKVSPHSSKEVVPSDLDHHDFSPTIKSQRSFPGNLPPPIPPKEPLPELESYSHARGSFSSDEVSEPSDDSMALISTRDLMAMDRLNPGMMNMPLSPRGQQQQLGSSPNNVKHLPWHVAGSLMAPEMAELPTSPNSKTFGSSPQIAPSTPYYPHQNGRPGLAPDRYGKDIPMAAQWTKINRNLVSPEVLERAGVRYEARPTYVAILGRLTREQIADFARQSADCRAARAMRRRSPPRAERPQTHQRTDSKSSRDEDDEESDLFDESDTTDEDDDKTSEKGTRSYPYIVSPPDKTSPASTVKPKSILKNRNENHVRFDASPREAQPPKLPPRPDDRDNRRSTPDRRRPPPRRDGSDHVRHYYRGDSSDGNHRPRSHHYDDRDYHHHHHSHPRRSSHRSEREKKSSKKKAWGETLGAVGLGGAAVSLLSVLAEAAAAV